MLEEEMKKKKNLTLDEWYNKNKDYLNKQRADQLEDAYANRELMNKYLANDLVNAGLSKTGIVADYVNQSNVDYRNEIANINKNNQDKQLELYNKYYEGQQLEKDKADALAKEEQMKQDAINKQNQLDIYNSYLHKLDNSKNEYGFIDDSTMNELNNYFDRNSIGEHYSTLLDNYINNYRPTQDQLDRINKDKAEKEASKYYDYYQSEFTDEVANKTLEDGTISEKDINDLLNKLENNKEKVGEKYYIDALNTLKTLDRKSKEYRDKAMESVSEDDINAIKKYIQMANLPGMDKRVKLLLRKKLYDSYKQFKKEGILNSFNEKVGIDLEKEIRKIENGF